MANSIVPFDQTLAQQLYDSNEQFPVDFEAAWQWLGYARKDTAKRALTSGVFVINQDYRVTQVHKSIQTGGLTHRENIFLTVDCFRRFAMMSRSKSSRCPLAGKRVAEILAQHSKALGAEIKTVLVRPELHFADLLEATVGWSYQVYKQYPCLGYYIDFYIPEADLVIEYDEPHHLSQYKEDLKRQQEIETNLGCKFIRVEQGLEAAGIRKIMKFLFEKKHIDSPRKCVSRLLVGVTHTHREDISLTIDCFKSFGMMAGTSQGKQVRKYFLECEKIAKQASQMDTCDFLVYQANRLRGQDRKHKELEQKQQQLAIGY